MTTFMQKLQFVADQYEEAVQNLRFPTLSLSFIFNNLHCQGNDVLAKSISWFAGWFICQ